MGLIERAYELLERSCQRDVTVWNAVITGCVENGHGNIAVDMFIRMHRDGVKHDNYTFASVLSMCGASERLGFGRQVHSLVVQTGYVVMVSAVNALVTMYFNCGLSNDACEIFQKAKAVIICNQVTYNAMISGLANQGRDMEAVIMFLEMREACFEPTEATLVSVFSLCMDAKMVDIGRQVHGVVIEMGFEAWTSLSNAVITMYSNYGDLGSACRVFEILQEKDIISWNSMIVGYAERSDFMSAITTYLQMQIAGMQPDDFTVCSLLTCSELRMSQNIHGLVSKNGLKLNPEVCNALISAFSKHGEFEHAYKIFREMTVRNLISWNSILSGCAFNELPLRGLEIFRNCTMSSSEEPDMYTLSIVLSICSNISSIRVGKQVHGYILRSGFGSEIPLGNALITMYAKCGVLEWSSKIFDLMTERNKVSWNAMISAYGQHGEGIKAVECFEAMKELGSALDPDKATFSAVLSACSHAGLVDEGCRIFSLMVEEYCVEPGMEQYSCIIDLLGRARKLDEAERLINTMPFKADSSIWWTVLSACKAHGNVRVGKIAADFLLDTEPNNPTVYVLLSSIYAADGQWEEAASIRELMVRNGATKQRGCSWIEPQNSINTSLFDEATRTEC
ncbi:hypothetical protein GIB67_029964 [Kingdonia uniflora]|uniref:Pentatricopeptide repeat-containing protein n=1 Tax=Kingdonia uniflora TaxID=39325 RepID=A0A7J7MXV9_9MAGN|nr:hypothetical protein GIB67_029964 [Kingdonia uniflora]